MAYTTFPLHGIVHDASGAPTCACRKPKCTRAGKCPAVRYSLLEPGDQVPPRGGGTALLTGIKSGVFVVDTDGEAADARFRALGDVPDTYTVRTPSGGRHYYFVWPGFPVRTSQGEFDRKEGEKTSKIDIRGDVNGYVVLPGSPHKSGRAYTTERNVAPVAAPDWLLAWDGLRGSSVTSAEDNDNAPFPVDVTTTVGQERVELGRDACATMDPSIAGENGSAAMWAVALRLVRDLELPLEVCAELVETVFNPRCDPPWSPGEILHKLEDARDKSDMPTGNVHGFDLSRVKGAPTRAPGSDVARYECALGDVGNMPAGKTSLDNVLAILSTHPSWAGVLKYDQFRDRVVAREPAGGGPRPIELEAERTCLVDTDVTAIRKWFGCIGGLVVSKDAAWECAVAVAKKNGFHPVREWLAGLEPVENPAVLDDAARLFFGASDMLDAVLVRKFMIGAVRRIFNPGEKMDTMLVLVGEQGAGKSTFVRALFGDDCTSEDLADIRTKDAMIGLAGKWAIEVAELDKLLRTDPETVKSFVSRCVDTYRAPYERVSTDHPRQCVYVGTTNKDDFLRDPTGERRYWIVDLEKRAVDLAAVRAWRERMWSAAYALARTTSPHWLTQAEALELSRRGLRFKEEHPWFDPVRLYCTGRETVVATEILRSLGIAVDRQDGGTAKKVTNILRELGCTNDGQIERRPGVRARTWRVPDHLRTAALTQEESTRRDGERIAGEILKDST